MTVRRRARCVRSPARAVVGRPKYNGINNGRDTDKTLEERKALSTMAEIALRTRASDRISGASIDCRVAFALYRPKGINAIISDVYLNRIYTRCSGMTGLPLRYFWMNAIRMNERADGLVRGRGGGADWRRSACDGGGSSAMRDEDKEDEQRQRTHDGVRRPETKTIGKQSSRRDERLE